MNLIDLLKKELEFESGITRRMLSIVPADKFDWKPHPKSMNIHALASHIAELPTWITLAVTTDGIDFASQPYVPTVLHSNADLMKLFEASLEDGRKHLETADTSKFEEPWIIRTGDTVHAKLNRYEVIRHAFSQVTHHRAQMGVNLRLLNIPIPGSYGPSADEPMM